MKNNIEDNLNEESEVLNRIADEVVFILDHNGVSLCSVSYY